MKKLFFPLLISTILISCSNAQMNSTGSEADANDSTSKKMSKRDYSITAANAYSTLFLDSSALDNFITGEKIPDNIARRMRSFYNTRNFQYAWFNPEGLTEQARGFWNLHDYVTTYENDSTLKDKDLQKKMDALTSEETLTVSAGDKGYAKTEMKLTQHFIEYMLNNYEKGAVKRKEMERFIPVKQQDALSLADSLINKKHKDDKYYEDVNESYKGLKQQLSTYYTIVKNGGWPTVPAGKYKKGIAAPGIATLKKRLQLSGDLAGTDTSTTFDDALDAGVRSFQERHGFTANGLLTDEQIKELNIPAEVRLQQILMNMDRMRWMSIEPKGNLIVVNIPEFILHVYEGKSKAFDMVVVVGKEGHNTMMFNGDLNQVVFSPYWNVPPSIVKKEILPSIEKNPNYLESQNMEITGNEGGLPVIRQKPGGKNALGKVKFLFPNSFNIYFHDTPSKSLFEKDNRAYSHGCIRLKEPEKMANYVLRNQPEWTPEKINEAMNAGEEKTVRVKDPIPVMITYYTAWVDDQGRLNFRKDIYGHDQELASKMFLH